MIVKAVGVWSYGKYGWSLSMLNQPEVIDTDKLPVRIGSVPIGLASWYKNPPSEKIKLSDENALGDDYLCPMRGSKRAIATKWDTRVYAYEYEIARKMGFKFGRLFMNTGKRLVVLKGEPCFLNVPHQCVDVVRRSFASGAAEAMGEDSMIQHDEKDFLFFKDGDKTVFVNFFGLNAEKRKAVIDLSWQLRRAS